MNHTKFFSRLFVLAVSLLAGLVLTYVFSLLGTVVFGRVPLLQAALQISSTLSALRWMQFLQNVFVFILPAVLLSFFCRTSPVHFLCMSRGKAPFVPSLLISVAGMVASLPLVNLLACWNESIVFPQALSGWEQMFRSMEDAAAAATEAFLSGTSLSSLLINLFIVAFMAAVSEEILFRGALLRMLRDAFGERMGNGLPHAAVWISAILFSAFHMQFYGFIPRMLMGAWFGYLLCWTGSLWVPMVAHFANNALAVILTFCANNGWIAEDFGETFGTGQQSWMSLLSLAVLCLCALYYRRSSNR